MTTLKTTNKVFQILEFLILEKRAFSGGEIATMFHIPESTVYRILATLRAKKIRCSRQAQQKI